MNWKVFSILGYLSVLLWLAIPLLWVGHGVWWVCRDRMGPRWRWLAHVALAFALIAFGFAKLNSAFYVNNIKLDQSDAIAAAQAKKEAKRKKAEAARAAEVVQKRFAEDDADDFLDKAGMEDDERERFEKVMDDDEPAWKQKKRARTGGATDDSLEAKLNPEDAPGGFDTTALIEDAENKGGSVSLKQADYDLANRLDGWNLDVVRLMFLLSLAALVVDYLLRHSIYEYGYLTLPLPSAFMEAFRREETVQKHEHESDAALCNWLKWMVKRGDVFVLLTDNAETAASLPAVMARLPKDLASVDVLHVKKDQPQFADDDFVFDCVWHGRASAVVVGAERSAQLLTYFVGRLVELRKTKSTLSQTAHIILDVSAPLPTDMKAGLSKLSALTGFRLIECVR